MQRKLLYGSQALRDLRGLDPPVARRVAAALNRYAETEKGDVRQLTGEEEPPHFRLRAGDWRILFERRGDELRVLRILHRSEAYR